MTESNAKHIRVNFENSWIFEGLQKSVKQQVVVTPTSKPPHVQPAKKDNEFEQPWNTVVLPRMLVIIACF